MRFPAWKVAARSRTLGSALVLATVTGCGDRNVAMQEPAPDERRTALAKSTADSLAFPEYDLNVPTAGWLTIAGDAAAIDDRINAGYRLHDLDVVSTSPLSFAGAFVANTNEYQRAGNWWAYNQTEQELLAIYADANRRIVDIAQYLVNGQWRYAAVWVSNTGTQHRNYKLVVNITEPAFLNEAVGYRVVSIEKGPMTTCAPGSPCIQLQTFSGVMIANVGNDARVQTFARSNMAGLRALMLSNASTCSTPPDAGATPICQRLALIEELGPDDYLYATEDVQEAGSPGGYPILGEGEQTWWASEQFLEVGNRNNPDSIEHMLSRLGARPQRLRAYDTPAGTRYIVTFARNDDVVPSQGSSDDGNAVLKEIDAIAARQMRRSGVPGMTLGIVQGGRLVHAKGYGYADLQNLRVTAATDQFRLASVSKALARGALVLLGHSQPPRMVTPPGGGAQVPVTLDDLKPWGQLWQYDPGPNPARPNLGDLTIRDLLTHQTALRYVSAEYCNCNATVPGCDVVNDVSPCNPFEELEDVNDPLGKAATPQNWAQIERKLRDVDHVKPFYIHRVGEYHPNACPGSIPTTDPACPSPTPDQYKNTHYHILGQVVEQVTGMTYDSYLRANFLDPLHLERVRVGKYEGTPPAGCAVPAFPALLSHAISYQLPQPYRLGWSWDYPWFLVLCNRLVYPAESYSASPIDLLRWATSIDGSTVGGAYEPLDAAGKSDMAAICVGGDCGVSHGGYFPYNTRAEEFEIQPSGATVPENLKVAFAFNSDFIDRSDLKEELKSLLRARSFELPKRDLFPTYLEGCSPNAPFDAPVPAFTGTMNADGLTFSADGQTAYISGRASTAYKIYVATRTSTGNFTTPTLLTEVNVPGDQRAPSLSPDGKQLFMTKAVGYADIAAAVRQDTSQPFGQPAPVAPLNSSVADQDPFWFVAPGGLQMLFFASERPDGAHRDIYQTIPLGSGTWQTTKLTGQPVNPPYAVNSPYEEYRPVLSPDGLTLYFASTRPGIANDTDGDIFMVSRPSAVSQFVNTPVNLWGLNTSGTDFPVNVSPDGCTLYFASNEATGGQNFRLYQAKRGASMLAQVTTRINIVGTGSVTAPSFSCSTGNLGTCAANGAPGSQVTLLANGYPSWSGSCTRNGASPSSDAVLVFANNGVCTVTFP